MNECITPNATDTTSGACLTDGHCAKNYAQGLPSWHPVRELFSGPSQRLGRIDVVYAALRLFSSLFEDKLAGGASLLQAPAPDVAAELAAFRQIFPNRAIYGGSVYKLHGLYNRARQAVQAEAGEEALRDFDITFAKLVRAVRGS